MLLHKYRWQNINKLSAAILFVVTILIFLLGCAVHYFRGAYYPDLPSMHSRGADDAYISFRYGWNLVHYGELSWNESGYRKTEGFTNPLWVFTSSLWAVIGNKELIYPLMVLTSVIITSLILAILFIAVYRKNDQSMASMIGLFLAIAAPAVWLHTTSGLESGVFAAGLATLVYLVLFPGSLSFSSTIVLILSFLLVLLRSDGFIYVSMIFIAAIIAGTKVWKFVAIGLVSASVLLFTWRFMMFDTWLPNTAIAKLNFNLVERIRAGGIFLLTIFSFSSLAIFLLFGIAGLRLEVRKVSWAGLLIFISWILYYLYMGGDIYYERHLIGLILLSGALSAPLWSKSSILACALMVTAILAGTLLTFTRDNVRFNYLGEKPRDTLVMLGKALAEDRSRYGVLVTQSAGKIPFYAGGDCIDTFGLNDPYLATISQERFMPGHSSGSGSGAIELAKLHPIGVYATFSFLDPVLLAGPEDVSLWINNYHPQENVQTEVTLEQWEHAIDTADLFIWSVISTPMKIK